MIMKTKRFSIFALLRRLGQLTSLTVALTLIVGASGGTGPAPASAQEMAAQPQVTEALAQKEAYMTTVAYVTTFYPLWFTYYQSQVASVTRLVGPERIPAPYQIVVAIQH